ncbi:MAG: ribonuclease HIII [Caldisericia bacterium]|nr:ribonuclease HIII [Caldisericia bacterium]
MKKRLENFSKYIGIDESGKGDFFGNLVIAGVIFDKKKEDILKNLNVRDSKKIEDSRIKFLANEIKKNLNYEIISISPKKFNLLYKNFKNMNILLSWAYSKVISNLIKKDKVSLILIDKFTNKNYIDSFLKDEIKNIERVEIIKGEKDIAIACASIIARDSFLKSILNLEKKWNFSFPKGAGDNVIISGIDFARKFGTQRLNEVAKINFKNYKKILELLSKENLSFGGENV